MDTSSKQLLASSPEFHGTAPTSAHAEGCSVISDIGAGRPVLLLHGGGGVATVAGLSQALGATRRVLMPTHPGFDGTPRPAHLDSVAALARTYVALLETLDLRDVVVIGSSIGGWVAAEMAAFDARRVRALVLLNQVGIDVPGEPVMDVSALSRPELIRLASHNPDLMMANAPPATPERMATLASNAAALAAYDQGAAMMAPGLRERLADITVPALVLWGESDGIATQAYGKVYASAFAKGSFELIREAGHLPHVEQAACVLKHIDSFFDELAKSA